MIEFSLTKEQKACQKLVREFAQKEINPIVHQLVEGQSHNPEIIEKYFISGLLQYIVPEKFDGLS
jgi:alkylation response protein AidB-like acyl-CoA dehydrogenase